MGTVFGKQTLRETRRKAFYKSSSPEAESKFIGFYNISSIFKKKNLIIKTFQLANNRICLVTGLGNLFKSENTFCFH